MKRKAKSTNTRRNKAHKGPAKVGQAVSAQRQLAALVHRMHSNDPVAHRQIRRGRS